MDKRGDTPSIKYARRPGTSGMGGQMYEVALIANIFWDAVQGCKKNIIKSFHLATNMEEAGDFDDIVIKYVVDKISKVVFVQAKHKEFPDKHKITLNQLLSDTKNNSFNLKKYFNTYLQIKNKFISNQPSDVIFGNDFQNTEFFLLTTAVDSFDKDTNFYEVIISNDNDLNLTMNTFYYKLHLKGNKSAKIISFFESDKKDIEEFLDKLKIYPRHPNLVDIKTALKETIKKHNAMADRTTEQKFAIYWQRIQSWWYSGDEFLTENSTFIHDLFDSVYFEVQAPAYKFIGREEQLKELYENLQRTDISCVTVSGLGGVGKTQLTRKYVELYCRDYGHIIWINAENSTYIRDSFMKLAIHHLNIDPYNKIDGTEKSIECILSETHKILSDRWYLIVFDNVEEPEHIRNYLPRYVLGPDSSCCHVIVTSRNCQWPHNWPVLHLECFTNDEATLYLEKTLKFESSKDEKQSLIETLQCFPLALYQATGYIKKQRYVEENYSIDQYLKSYQREKQELLEFKPTDLNNSYEKTTRTTWLITINTILKHKYGNTASIILCYMAYMAPVNIPRDTFKNLIKDEHELKESVRLIVGYSLVQAEKGQSILSMHRILQSVIRFEIKKNNREIELLICILEWMVNIKSNILEITYHAFSVWDFVCKHKTLKDEYTCFFTTIIRCSFFYEKSEVLEKSEGISSNADPLKITQNKQRLKIIQEIYDMSKQRYGTMNKITLEIQHILSLTLYEQNNLPKALNMYRDLYKKIMQNSLFRDLMAFTVRIKIAEINYLQRKYNKALKKYRAILRDKQLVKTKSTEIDSLMIQHNINLILQKQNKLSEIIEIDEEICKKQCSVLGSAHPDIKEELSEIPTMVEFFMTNQKTLINLFTDLFYRRYEPETKWDRRHSDTLVILNTDYLYRDFNMNYNFYYLFGSKWKQLFLFYITVFCYATASYAYVYMQTDLAQLFLCYALLIPSIVHLYDLVNSRFLRNFRNNIVNSQFSENFLVSR